MKSVSTERTEPRAAPKNPWLEMSPAFGMTPVDYLFVKLQAMYPTRWRHDFPDQASTRNWRTTWGEGLLDARITKAQFQAGIEQCEQNSHRPPSLAEFIAACRVTKPRCHRSLEPLPRNKRTEQEKAVADRYFQAMYATLDAAAKARRKRKGQEDGDIEQG